MALFFVEIFTLKGIWQLGYLFQRKCDLDLVTLTFESDLPPHLPVGLCEVSSLCDKWLLRYKEISENQLFDLVEVIWRSMTSFQMYLESARQVNTLSILKFSYRLKMRNVRNLTHSVTGNVTLTFKIVTLTPLGQTHLLVWEVGSLCDY